MKKVFQTTAFLLLVSLTTTSAQRKGGGRGGDRAAEREFQSVKGEFDAWKKVVLESGALKIPGENGAEGASRDFYQFLVLAAQEERLSDKDFADFGQEYIKLVLKGQKQGAASVASELESLRTKAMAAADGVLDAATATLQVNRQQVDAQELLWFGIVSDKISQGKRSTITRKQSALLTAEEKAKSDKKVDEREREKLTEDASEIVQELKESLAS
ncbi:MAG: hypothetical protein ACSHYB_06155 [Roseibacillus sp.]